MTRSERDLRVLLANEREEDLRTLADVLDSLGHEVTPFAVSVSEAVELIAREDPDVAFVVFDGDDEHGLALLSETVEYASGPVLVTVRETESATTVARAADMGIAGYVDSWAPHDVQAVIERAKGILMERHGIDDREAFARLRDHARSGGRRVVEIAQAVLDGHALLPKR